MPLSRHSWDWMPVSTRRKIFNALPKPVQLTMRSFMRLEPTTNHFGYDINTRLMNMTGGGPDTFDAISGYHLAALQQFVGISPDHSVLEIGCGIGRDAIQLSNVLSSKGNYVGIDIIKDSIDWCSDNITSRHPNFRFIHYDVADQLHNPGGSAVTESVKLPVADQSIDRIFLWSVFTHMTMVDIVHYLREFARSLRPNGVVYATWFVVDDAVLAKARTVNITPFNLRFEHQLDDGCYINDLQNPMGAVAYTKEAILEAVRSAGLAVVGDVLPGAWSAYYEVPKGGQDATILRLNH
jgi:SAM-dependent methyltransferase